MRDDELYHYGRKGMRWGQHIFGDNPDNDNRLISKYDIDWDDDDQPYLVDKRTGLKITNADRDLCDNVKQAYINEYARKGKEAYDQMADEPVKKFATEEVLAKGAMLITAVPFIVATVGAVAGLGFAIYDEVGERKDRAEEKKKKNQ